ncbi:lipopolysaccharide biosynthesis protein [Listeria aquatica]|uniref:lipopolysaccharide biosynthesis protein n=1 Tax=Listeria aquatica TaxID=1494960 RepID=UPI003F713399
MSILLRRLFHFTIGSFGSALLNLITIPVITYFITPEEYGKTSMFLVAQSLLILVINLGYDQAFAREFYEYKDKKNLLVTALIMPFLFAILLASGMIIFSHFFSQLLFGVRIYDGIIVALAISVFLLILERFFLLLFRMENRGLEFSFFNILIKFSILVCTVLFLTNFKHNFITVIYAMIVGQMLGDFLLSIRCLSDLNLRHFQFDFDLLKKMSQFGLPIVLANFIYGLLVITDKLFLGYLSNFEQLGLYTAAFKIASALLIFQTTFTNLWVPTAYEWYQKKKPISYFQGVSECVMGIIALFFVLLLLFKGIIIFILPNEYQEAQYIFPFLCFYPLMMTASSTTQLGIVFFKKSYLNIIVSLIAIVVAFTLYICLIPEWGAIGAAIATGTAYIALFLAKTYFSMRIWKGFSIKRHSIVTFILYILAFLNSFSHQLIFISILNLSALVLLLWIYYPVIKWGISFIRNKKSLENV